MRLHPPPLLAVHASVLLFGAAGLFGKWISLPAHMIVLGRVVFAAVVLGGLLAALRRRTPPVEARSVAPGRHRDTWALPLLGLLLAVHWVTFFHAIQVSTVAVGLLTFATFPVFTALLEPVLPGERLEASTLGAALVTVAGVALVVPSTELSDPVVRGAGWGVVSGATFAVLSVVNRGLVRRRGPLDLAFHQDVWAAVFLAPFALAAPRPPTGAEWGLLIVLGVVFTAGAHALFIHGLSGVRAGRAAVIAALEPVYGVALAALLLDERPGGRVVAGGALVLGAALWVSRPGHAGEGEPPPNRTPDDRAHAAGHPPPSGGPRPPHFPGEP